MSTPGLCTSPLHSKRSSGYSEHSEGTTRRHLLPPSFLRSELSFEKEKEVEEVLQSGLLKVGKERGDAVQSVCPKTKENKTEV